MIEYDVGRYQEGVQRVRDSAIEAKKLPLEYREKVIDIVKEAVQGTFEACQEIYDSKENINNLGSDRDHETDKKGLKDLVKLFSPF